MYLSLKLIIQFKILNKIQWKNLLRNKILFSSYLLAETWVSSFRFQLYTNQKWLMTRKIEATIISPSLSSQYLYLNNSFTTSWLWFMTNAHNRLTIRFMRNNIIVEHISALWTHSNWERWYIEVISETCFW